MEQRRNWADPGRGEEIVYMGGPRIAHCKDYGLPRTNKKKIKQQEKKKKKQQRDFSLLLVV